MGRSLCRGSFFWSGNIVASGSDLFSRFFAEFRYQLLCLPVRQSRNCFFGDFLWHSGFSVDARTLCNGLRRIGVQRKKNRYEAGESSADSCFRSKVLYVCSFEYFDAHYVCLYRMSDRSGIAARRGRNDSLSREVFSGGRVFAHL